jgi:hypothetical protein
MLTTPDGRQVPVPAGVDAKKAREFMAKMAAARSGGGMPQFSEEDRQVMQQLRAAGVLGGGPGAGGRTMAFGPGGGDPSAMGSNQRIQRNLARSATRQAQAGLAFGGSYIVFVNRGGQPTAVPVNTGLTDLDYSEVVDGLTEADSILVLPSASLIAAQEQFEQMRQRMSSPIPGARVGGGGGNVQVRR